MSCDVLRNLSCVVLRIVRENHRRGQKQGNQKAGEGEGISNIGAQTTGAERERQGRGDGLSNAHCMHSACENRGGRRRTEGRGQSARRWDTARPGAGVKGVSCDVLSNLSCIVLRVMHENHRRGQKQGNQRAGEGEGNSNTGAQTTGRRGRGRGGRTGLHRTLHAQCVRRQRGQEKDGGAGTECQEVGRRTARCRGDEWGRAGCASYSVTRSACSNKLA